MVGEEEVTAISGEGLQSFDGCIRCEIARQVLPTLLDANAVAHDPTSRLLFYVEVINVRGLDDDAFAGVHVVLLEPCNGILLVGTLLIVISNEHCHYVAALLDLIRDIEAHGLTLADATIAIACLYSICYINIRRSLLDEVAVHHLIEVHDISIILDNLDTRLSAHRRIVPAKGYLTATLGVFCHEVGYCLTIVGCFVFYIGAGSEQQGCYCNVKIKQFKN